MEEEAKKDGEKPGDIRKLNARAPNFEALEKIDKGSKMKYWKKMK